MEIDFENRIHLFVAGAALILFHEEQEYRYSDVRRSKYQALLAADSIGEFVNREIKPHHPCIEMTSFSHSR